jgi:hydrogenase maturation protease
MIKDKEKVVIVDCVDFKGNPGEIVNFKYGDVENVQIEKKFSLHNGDIIQMLDMAKTLNLFIPVEIIIIGIQPKYVGQTENLSDEVKKSLPKVINMVKLLVSTI